ncbi:MAG: hypothetical protein JNK49_15825 [Planctomycetes bacterium]|nr:hypothetical protein [Planctomycetota bacterium]
MHKGADAIVQAPLRNHTFFGIADVLLRVDPPSALGNHTYEPVDTKLATETKAGALLQLLTYCELPQVSVLFSLPRYGDTSVRISRTADCGGQRPMQSPLLLRRCRMPSGTPGFFMRAVLLTSLPLPLFAALATAQNWTLATPATSPAAATFPRMVFDVQRSVCVAFGGWDAPIGNVVFQDTWEWNGTNWTRRSPATVPDERESHMMAYDLGRGRTVMFGGQDFNFVLLGQTWEWNGTNWLNRQPANAPSARIWGAMAYDVQRGRTVLFGGEDANSRLNDTWEWDGTNWSQRSPATSPAVRANHAMAYDQARGRTVLFGGAASATQFFNDTWEYNGTNWVQVITDGAPPARVDHQIVYDSARARCVLFGGADLLIERNDTWEWNGTRWHRLFTATTPPGNGAMAMAYDSVRNRTVVFGGFDGAAALGTTWQLGGNAATFRTFGSGCLGSNNLPPTLVPTAMPTLGTTSALTVTNLPAAAAFAVLAIGFSDQVSGGNPLPLNLTSLGLTGCRAYTSAEATVLLPNVGGTATWNFSLPNNAAFAGVRLFQQALSLDTAVARPIQAATSNAAEMNLR